MRIRSRLIAAAVLALATVIASPVARAQADTTTLPRVLIITTGGTIAGVQQAPGTLGSYRAGALGASDLLAAVPVIATYARVESEAFAAVASTMITPAQWVGLSRRINEVLKTRPEIAGVVVTHGTDRLEETAFFLYLTVQSDKPVVVVGAQRPATGISPDGPINLLAAVRTAASPRSMGKGVMVVMDDRILSAREARKFYPRAGGFDGGEMGMLGVMSGSGPEYFFTPVRRHGSASEFNPAAVTTLPDVDLVFAYPGGTGRQYAKQPDGVVVSSTGFTCAESGSYQLLARSGVVVVTAFPSGEHVAEQRVRRDSAVAGAAGAGAGAAPGGARVAGATGAGATGAGATGVGATGAGAAAGMRQSCPALDSLGLLVAPWVPTVSVQHLTPQKARILLMLALTKTRDPREVQRYFDAY